MILVRDIPFAPERMETWFWCQPVLPEEHDRQQTVRAVLDKLPKLQLEIINAVYFERIPKRAVARRLGISRTSVQRHILKVAKLLEEALDAPLR